VKRALLIIAAIIAVPAAVFAAWFATAQYEDWRYIRPWQRVARGDSEERVIALLGRPHRIIEAPSDKAAWEADGRVEWYDAEFVKSFRYIPFSITGEEYEVSFDSSGRAVSKYHYSSP
jgi:hypothetical protein